jgi:hypothetical protein
LLHVFVSSMHLLSMNETRQETTRYVEPVNKIRMAFKVLKSMKKKRLKNFKNSSHGLLKEMNKISICETCEHGIF